MNQQFLLLFFCAVLLSACNGNQRQAIIRSAPLISTQHQDDAGRTLRFFTSPKRVVSLAPNLTEMVFAVGAGNLLVARSSACDYPGEALFLPAFDLEAGLPADSLLAMKADVILLPKGYFPAADIDMLVEAGLPLFELAGDSLRDVYRGLRMLGHMLGKTEQASQLADSLEKTEQSIVARTQNMVAYGTVMVLEREPLTVAGGTGLLQELIVKAGGKNRYADSSSPLVSTTEAELFDKKPEYLLIPNAAPQMYQLLIEQYPSLYDTQAAAKNQVFVLQPELVFRAGPRVLEGLRQMASALHSEMAVE